MGNKKQTTKKDKDLLKTNPNHKEDFLKVLAKAVECKATVKSA